MFVKLKDNKQEELIKRALEKAGSYRKLARAINIPRASISAYLRGRLITEVRLNSVSKFLRIKDIETIISEKLLDNWRQIKGGKNCVVSKKEKGTFTKEMKKWQDFQAKKLKRWHKFMKKNRSREYYLIQYSRFKKIAGYKYLTKKGEKVRNLLEKDVADLLYHLKIEYEYEPLLKIGNRYFFPDFLINNEVIIECTMWRGEQKAYKLRDKIKTLNRGYRVFVLIPKNLYRYYKIINSHLIVGLDEFVPVAQTFLKRKGSNR